MYFIDCTIAVIDILKHSQDILKKNKKKQTLMLSINIMAL
jgi:hypothetical protein